MLFSLSLFYPFFSHGQISETVSLLTLLTDTEFQLLLYNITFLILSFIIFPSIAIKEIIYVVYTEPIWP
jgi:hypothetical protein